MSSKSKKKSPKKIKSKIAKLMEKSDSDSDDGEHELSFYVNDRVKLMKEVLKIIKPKKIKSMAPDCIKDLDIEEINSMLLEELLGISNKRLKYIFNGQNPAEDSSSTNSEEDKPPVDIISLDDVSEDDFVIIDSDSTAKKREKTLKKKIKKEKSDNSRTEPLNDGNLMSVLELLELQARARAIRSQLMLEANKKTSNDSAAVLEENKLESEEDDAVIMEIPTNEEIVIDSSESDDDPKLKEVRTLTDQNTSKPAQKKIKLIRDRIVISVSNQNVQRNVSEKIETALTNSNPENLSEQNEAKPTISISDGSEQQLISKKKSKDPSSSKNIKEVMKQKEKSKEDGECISDEDEIILVVDQEEMAGIIGE